jgi:hypothetical protein
LALACACLQASYIILAEHGPASSSGGGLPASATVARKAKQHQPGLPLQDLPPPQAFHYRAAAAVVSNGEAQPLQHELHCDGDDDDDEGPHYGAAPPALGAARANSETDGGSSGSSAGSGPAGGGPADVLYCMAVLGMPLLTLIAAFSGEAALAGPALAAVRARMPPLQFAAWAGSTAVMEGVLTGSLILCAQLNSALTTSVVGVLKGVVAVVLGFFFLGGARFSTLNVAGIAMNTGGGVWYAAAKYRSSAAGAGKRGDAGHA